MTLQIDGVVAVETPILTVTSEAIARITGLLTEKGLTAHGLRVFVAGGGCSGMQYGMAFDSNPREDDRIIEIEGVRLIIDPDSLTYVRGSSIDFIDNPMGGGFRIDNPNVVSTCGCGHSFHAGGEHDGEATGGCNCH